MPDSNIVKYRFEPKKKEFKAGALPAIIIDKLKKEYILSGGEKVLALKEINACEGSTIMPIRKGEFLMLRGPSGCGKTTLLNIIGTIDRLTSGKIGKPSLRK